MVLAPPDIGFVVHQPLIASYKRDFEWLFHFLRSFSLKANGFAPPVVVVPSSDVAEATKMTAEACPGTIVRPYDVPERHRRRVWAPFMRAQVAMMSGDVHCPGADFVWLWGSDCFVSGDLNPADQFVGDKPVMPYSTYAHLAEGHPACLCWRAGTASALGWVPDNEFMRRLPLIYPAPLYPEVRRHLAGGSDDFGAFEDRVFAAGERKDFSESNVLGAYAWQYMHDAYHWFLVDGFEYGKLAVKHPTRTIQFWSHGGMDKPCDQHHRFHGRTPRDVMESYYRSWRQGTPLEP